MKATIQSTDQLTHILQDGHYVRCRVWEGVSDGGVKFVAYIPLIQVHKDEDNSQFEAELEEQKPASADTLRAIDMRYIID